ncbi:hypothetical protein [Alkalinema pantanalense]
MVDNAGAIVTYIDTSKCGILRLFLIPVLVAVPLVTSESLARLLL